jgi:hypothetical protein
MAHITALYLAAHAVEGMWLPEQVPDLGPELTEQGLELDPTTLADPLAPPLRSIVSLGFCSAAFISPDGLIATNHHCVQGYLQVNSSAKANRARDGFLAIDRSQELSAGPGAQVTIVEKMTDVTEIVRTGLSRRTKDRDRESIIQENIAGLVDTCESQGDDRRCRVASYDGGANHRLVESRVLKDVRIVYAPPNSVGNYGDDIDNWMWPRHSGDFALLRAYVAPDGQTATYAKSNVPFKPDAHLAIDTSGAQEDEFVMVAGFPGRTGRYRPARSARFAQAVQYPFRIQLYGELIELLRDESAKDPEAAARLGAPIAGISNGKKNSEGMLAGFQSTDALARKDTQDAALREWIAADRTRQRAYAPAMARIDALTAQSEAAWKRDFLMYWLVSSSDLLSNVHRAWRLANERQKPDEQRDASYRDRNVERLIAGSKRLDRSLWLPADRVMLARLLREVVLLDGGEAIPEIDAWVAAHGGLENAVAELFNEPAWVDTDTRLALFDASLAELQASDDPWITLARAADAQLARMRYRDEATQGAMLALSPVKMAAIRQMATEQGGQIYPDANGTLRLTFGHVQGVSPRDGVRYTTHTTVRGVVAKAGDKPFDAPETLLAAAPDAPSSRWADEDLGDVPVNFLTDLDTTGGNSGSATLNGKGEMVGLIFDGTYESMTGDWAFDPAQTRSIHVDVRYLLWMLESVEGADHILDELGLSVVAPEEPMMEDPASDEAPVEKD